MAAKKQRITANKGRPVELPTHIVVENVRLLGMSDGVPNSVRIGFQTGVLRGNSFQAADLNTTPPIDAARLVARDPALFKRLGELLTEELAEELGEQTEIDP